MDFTKILDAIDIIVNQKLTEAAFTRFINGTVVEIVNSEQNTYKVTTDNGKTNFIAQAIAADIDGGIVYEKNDEVKLLQLNGSNNSNENIYILGHSVDFTKQDLNEIKNHFIENVSQKITLNDQYTYILENSSDVIKDIKLKGSFGIKAQIKYLKQNSNNKKNYGFKISFKDKNNVNLLTYNLDVNTMVGEPYKFTDFVLQKIEKYLINTSIIDKINSIVIQAFNTDDFEYKDLEIYSAIWTEDENEYQITFKNPTRVDYITTKENDKEEFSLQAILLKNNKTFATNTCKYLWFRQDASIDNNSDAYSSYGGEGWRLLNTVEKITYLNINQEEYVQDVIKNDIGSCLKITNENTTSYHNYFKCVVLYNGLIIKSEVKHILNLDAAGDINFRLGMLTEKAATEQEIASLDEKNNTYTEDGFYLGFIFNSIKEYNDDNYDYEVVITRTNNIDDNNDKYIFSTTNSTLLLNENNQYYNILEKQIYDNIYPSYTYNCVISAIKEGIKITLQTIEKTYYVLDSEVKEIVQYYNNKDSVVMPAIIKENEWVDNYEELNSGNWTAINIIGRKKLNIQTKWEYFWAFIHGSSQTADQVEEFNRLTRNGKDKGLYYGKGYRVTEDIKPLDRKIYYIYNENESKYEAQESLKEFDPNKIYYEKTNDLALFINADYIQTGTLRVGNEKDEKFFASITNDEVSIGGFTVDQTSLQWYQDPNKKDTSQGYVYLGQEGLKLGNNFAIDQNGNVSWNASNSPIKQRYHEKANTLPVHDEATKTWNYNGWSIENNNSKYYIQSSDGGNTWAGPFLIQGEPGEAGRSITKITNYYLATEDNIPPKENNNNWIQNLKQTDFNEQYKYLWLKQEINYSKDPTKESNIYLCSIWGEKGASGNDGKGIKQIIVKYICLDENTVPDKNSNWQETSEANARNNLTASTPVLWKWIQFLFTDNTTEDSIFILDRLKQNTFIRYADMNAFKPDEYDNNKKGFFSQTRDIEIQSEKIYYVYNSETKKYLKVENPEKENLKSYYEFLVLKSGKDIYTVATANTGWIGTYVGYNANPSFSDYIWSYYLTELNRNNFMMNVLEGEKDADGNDVDGIYSYTGKDGKDYIGITASAIKTGALKVGDSSGETLFSANVQDKGGNVTIGGFTVTKNSLSWMKKNDDGSSNENQYVYLGEEGLKLGKSFNVTQTGDISWNATNSPIKQIYCENNTASLPNKKEDYNNLPNDSNTTWHKKVSDSDLYYAQSSDGGETWVGPFLIKGSDGKPGEAGSSPYHLQISSPVHCGSQQTSNITIILKQGKDTITNWKISINDDDDNKQSVTNGVYTLETNIIQGKNENIKIAAFVGDTQVDNETITYSPLNSPVLDLDNDSATLAATAGGDVYSNQQVSSTPMLYLNGEKITNGVTYKWALRNGTITNDFATVDKETDKLTVTAISAKTNYTDEYICIATYKEQQYQKVFTVTKVKRGEPGATGATGDSPYHLQISSPIHCSSQQTSDITIKLYYGTTLISSFIKCYNKQGEEVITLNEYVRIHTLKASDFKDKNYDIIIEAYTSPILSIFQDSEIITYSPLNTPVLDLTNDNDTLLYKYDDNGETVKVDLNQKVSTTANLYLNGEAIMTGVTYEWKLRDVTIDNKTHKLTVTAISGDKTNYTDEYICTATYKEKTYQKVFTVVKLLQGKDGNDGNDGNDGQSVYIKYVDIKGFQNLKKGTPQDTTDKTRAFVPTLDEIQNNDKDYYEYNEKTNTFAIATEFSKKCYEYVELAVAEGKTMYSTPNSNTGWMGTYTGTTEPTKIGYYKWTYYLTQLNRNNFMSNVLKTAEDNTGNYIDGIYSYIGKDDSTYIGINATAIQTGSLLIQRKQGAKQTLKFENLPILSKTDAFGVSGPRDWQYVKIENIDYDLFIKKYTILDWSGERSDGISFSGNANNITIYNSNNVIVFQISSINTLDPSLTLTLNLNCVLKKDETYCNFNIDKKQVTLIAPNVINGVGDFSYNNALFYLDSTKDEENFSIKTDGLQMNSRGDLILNNFKGTGGTLDNLVINKNIKTVSKGILTFQNKNEFLNPNFFIGYLNSDNGVPKFLRNDTEICLYDNDTGFLFNNISYTGVSIDISSEAIIKGDTTITSSAAIVFPWFPYGSPMSGSITTPILTTFNIRILKNDSANTSNWEIQITTNNKTNREFNFTIYFHRNGDAGEKWVDDNGKPYSASINYPKGSQSVKYNYDKYAPKLPYSLFKNFFNGVNFFKGSQNTKEYSDGTYGGETVLSDSLVQVNNANDYIGFCISGNLLPYNADPINGIGPKFYNLGCALRPWGKGFINELYMQSTDSNTNSPKVYKIYIDSNGKIQTELQTDLNKVIKNAYAN